MAIISPVLSYSDTIGRSASGSAVAAKLCSDWERYVREFIVVRPAGSK